jgi:carbamoyl-phosphate synthase large subunit
LTTQMKSVGEAMSIGRTFKESLQKGIRSMEVKRFGLGLDANDKWLNARRGKKNADGSAVEWPIDEMKLSRKLTVPSQGRMYYLRYALKMGWSIDRVYAATKIDKWYLDQLKQLVDFEDVLVGYERLEDVPREVLFKAKQYGYSDPQLANLYLGEINTDTILRVRAWRKGLGVVPVYKLVDTCAAEFEAKTPYYYSTYETPVRQIGDDGSVTEVVEDEVRVTGKKKVIILGGGPNRIGQGIEFDYCCVQAAFAADEMGYESVMVNSNPETVSTDYDTSGLLFFEPLTLEDVLNLCERLNGGAFGDADSGGHVHGVIVQFGGQTPLNLAHGLEKAGVPIIGTAVDSIDLAEDRKRFSKLIEELGIKQPANGIALDVDEAIKIANKIGYPVLVRPSFVLGGRAMATVYDDEQLKYYMAIALGASDLAGQPILIDQFLSEAVECDVDVVGDYGGRGSGIGYRVSEEGQAGDASSHDGSSSSGPRTPNPETRALVCGVLEHIEEAGIHSGDSACTIPPYSLPGEVVEELKSLSRRLAEALSVRGLMNVQWAVRRPGEGRGGHEIYVIEVNPRASRTVPFVSKACGISWALVAAKVMIGRQLSELGVTEEIVPKHTSVKESVFPFSKFPGVDVILGPEMRSTGECMGADLSFPMAFAKSQMSAGVPLPTEGKVFLSVRDSDKPAVEGIARGLVEMGFEVCTTGGTHAHLLGCGVETIRLHKISEGRPNAVDLIKNGEIGLVINTPTRKGPATDEAKLRATAIRFNTPMITTLTAASCAVEAIGALREGAWEVRALQDYFPEGVRQVRAGVVR